MGNCTSLLSEVTDAALRDLENIEEGKEGYILAGYYNLQKGGSLVFNTVVNLMKQSITQKIYLRSSSNEALKEITLPAGYVFDGETVNVTGSTARGPSQVALKFSRILDPVSNKVTGSIDSETISGISYSTPVPLTVFNGTYTGSYKGTGKPITIDIFAASAKAATIKINDRPVNNLTYDTNKTELIGPAAENDEKLRLILQFSKEAAHGLQCFHILPGHFAELQTNKTISLKDQNSLADPMIGLDLSKYTGFYGFYNSFVSVVDKKVYKEGIPTSSVNIGTFVQQKTSSQWIVSSEFSFSNDVLTFPAQNSSSAIELEFTERSGPEEFPTTVSSIDGGIKFSGNNYFSPVPLTAFANKELSGYDTTHELILTLRLYESNGKMTIHYCENNTTVFQTQNFEYYPHITKVWYGNYSLKFYIAGRRGIGCVLFIKDVETSFFFEYTNVDNAISSLGKGWPVAVTGADGFIGSHIVKLLLAKGYKVHGTVRDSTTHKVEFLKYLQNDKNLKLFEKRLLGDGFYDDAFKGCDCVFHTASPTLNDMAQMQNPEKKMIKQARDGTRNVLKACVKECVKAVVFTSSMCAATPTPCPPKISEACWGNSKEKIGKCGWYGASKIKAEKAAIDFHEQHRKSNPPESTFQLTRILPTWTVGPMLQPKVNSSMKRFTALINGSLHKEIKNRSISFVDVRDVAKHHVAAYEKGLEGRFFSLTEGWHWSTVYSALKCYNHDMKIPKRLPPGTKHIVRRYCTERRDMLGVKLRSVHELLGDAVEECKSKGLVKFKDEEKMVYRSPMMLNSKTVAVTGADGFIGSHIINLLLSKGYKVHGTVRDRGAENVEFLKLLPHAMERLTLFKGELLHDGCYDAAFKGCHCVFHVASPTLSDMAQMQNPEKMMIAQARDGTLNVLRSCVKAGVKVVVFTSSMCAATPTPCPSKIGEAYWGNPKKKLGKCGWYGASKILAEKAAVDFHAELTEESAFRLVRILPTFTVGPMLQPKVNSSMKRFASICSGNLHENIKNRSISFIDVRDTAAHHVAAYEKGCEGRFFSLTEGWHWNVVYGALTHLNPAMALPKPLDEGVAIQPVRQYDTTRRDMLGVKLRTVMQVLTDAVEECRKKMMIQSL